MSTLDGAVPLGLGITKLRLWDELHRAHREALQHSHYSPTSSLSTTRSYTDSNIRVAKYRSDLGRLTSPHVSQSAPPSATQPSETKTKKRRLTAAETTYETSNTACSTGSASLSHDLQYSSQTSFSDWFVSNYRGDSLSEADAGLSTSSTWAEPKKDSQGVVMPPPPPMPGPSRRKPPPLVARIKAKARRAKRKQQKAEFRRRLFLAHMVQATRDARQQNTTSSAPSAKASEGIAASAVPNVRTPRKTSAQQVLSMFPERLGVDLGTFVEVVFDTDAQSSEITAPSDISDDDLAKATKTEIETRKRLGGADVMVPKGVFRWMVGRDFAERWPQKVQGVRKNPWPGLEDVWGLPSSVAPGETMQNKAMDGPMRWQSGRRSQFIRRKEKQASQTSEKSSVSGSRSAQSSSSASAVPNVPQVRAMPALVPAPEVSPMIPLAPQPQRHLPQQGGWPTITVPYGAAIPNSKLHSDWPDVSFGTSDLIFSSWDWNSALACSHSATLPSAAAGMPIRLV